MINLSSHQLSLLQILQIGLKSYQGLKLLKENEPNMYPIRVNWGLNGFGSIDDNKFTEASIGGVMIVNENGKIRTELITESAEKLKAEFFGNK